MKPITLFIALVVLLASCGGEQAQEAVPEPEPAEPAPVDTEASLDPAKGIDWFEGSVDEAFAAAKASGKPIYLYWGAVWCPPCHAISATVFKSPDFLERSKLFIPVYLDGDTENAQEYGEKFGVRGYPTMIVFDPDGEEITRIPGGIDLQAYANILDLTLGETSSAKDLVATLTAVGDPLAANDCTLLAYYSWGQDLTILEDVDVGGAYRNMYEACPADMQAERSILYFNWLDEAITAAQLEEDPVPLTESQKLEALAMVQEVLADEALIKANIFNVILGGAEITGALSEPGSETRAMLTADFYDALNRIAGDDSIYKRERIYTLIGKMRFEHIDDEEAPLSDELQAEIREMVQWADQTTPNVYERQPIINALGNVLDDAGMDDVAKPLMLAELEKSKQPYYFMVSLADIEQRAENYDAAVEWLKKAYDSTKGPATRFQWGYYYLAGLLEMKPDETELIQSVTVGLIDELQNSGGLYHRPKSQLGRIEQRLRDWSEANGYSAELADIRKSVMDICETAVHQGESRTTCDAFLENA